MRDDFCVFILTHGRPDNVKTFASLAYAGYTGKTFLVVDNEDSTIPEYVARFGHENVLVFDKAAVASKTDSGDNFPGRKAILYARNVCFDLAEKVGCRYFVQFDDDYTSFFLRVNSLGRYGSFRIKSTMDDVFCAFLDFFESVPALTVAFSQGGDWIGGFQATKHGLKRKAMNSFFCSTDRRFDFVGKLNEDVNTYTSKGRAGALFLTVMQMQLNQAQTQSQKGGLTEAYLDGGTYLKTFYTVLYALSCAKVSTLSDPRSPHSRIHHSIDWNATAPKIVSESLRKAEKT